MICMLTNSLVTLRLTPKTSVGIQTVKKERQPGYPSSQNEREMVVVWLSETEQAEEFNGQFTDVCSKTSENEVPLLEKSTLSMSDIYISNEGDIKMMKGLNPSKALGPDEFHPGVLKELAVERGPVFAHLFQQSLDKGEIPKEWSLANICPLYKKGNRALPSNYRPVSLTCSLQDA